MKYSALSLSATSNSAQEVDDSLRPMLLFTLGGESFAIGLEACEEVLEWPVVERVSGMPPSALGVFALRDQLVSLYSPERVLRVTRSEVEGVALVIHAPDKRIALALDDVDEVIAVDIEALKRPAPRDAADGLLLGIARHAEALVAVLDVEALAAASMNTRAGESR
jgi:chemotaxis signal transduction protein